MPEGSARIFAGSVACLDHGFAQEIAADQDEQRDQQAASGFAFFPALTQQARRLQEPGQSQSAASDHAPESLTFLARIGAN